MLKIKRKLIWTWILLINPGKCVYTMLSLILCFYKITVWCKGYLVVPIIIQIGELAVSKKCEELCTFNAAVISHVWFTPLNPSL